MLLKYTLMPALSALHVGMCRYTNTTDNDLNYWGLDYPPLSGYQVGTPVGVLSSPKFPAGLLVVAGYA